jgi:Heparinase II/III N-terminus/Heparinase II/III-like protein
MVVALVAAGLLSRTPAAAGPVFDSVLNPMRQDLNLLVPHSQAEFQPLAPRGTVGQTFTPGADVRILKRIVVLCPWWQDAWHEGVTLTCTLYDGPERKRRLASGTLTFESHAFDDATEMFNLEVPVRPGRPHYFELQLAGAAQGLGIGKARRDYPRHCAYVDGVPQSFDLSFGTDVIPRISRSELEARKARFFGEFDLDRIGDPELTRAVQAKSWERAGRLLVRHFEAREDLFPPGSGDIVPDPKFDRTAIDLLLRYRFEVPQGTPARRSTIVDHTRFWNWEVFWPERGGVGLGRSGHRGTFARAYRATGDPAIARAFNDYLIDFFRDNPSPLRAPRTVVSLWGALDPAARLAHAFSYYAYFLKSKQFTHDTRLAWLYSMGEAAEYLDDWIARTEGGGNWKLQVASAMFGFGVDFPEWKRAKERATLGLHELSRNILENTFEDGVIKEAAVNYHGMYLSGWRRDIDAAKRAGIPFPEDALLRLDKMHEFYAYFARPDGMVPPIGDTYGPIPVRDYLTWAAEYFERPDFAYIASLGTGSPVGTPPAQTHFAFPQAGYYAMRTDWSPKAHYLGVHAGPWWGGHGHMDQLGIVLSAFGKPVVIDPGMTTYGTPEAERLHRTDAHSTVCVDGGDSSRDMVGENEWEAAADHCRFSGAVRVRDDIVHRRAISFAPHAAVGAASAAALPGTPDGCSFTVHDAVSGIGEHEVAQLWQFDTDVRCEERGTALLAYLPDGSGVAFVCTTPDVRLVKRENRAAYSPEVMKEIPSYAFVATRALPAEIVTVIVPFSGA